MIDHLAGLCRSLTGLSLNEERIPPSKSRMKNGRIALELRAEDFPRPTDELWLGLEFAPLDTSSWSTPDERDLGAPIAAIELKLLPF